MEEVAALLGLTSVLESRVGGALDRGISGECLVGGWCVCGWAGWCVGWAGGGGGVVIEKRGGGRV